MATHSLKEFTTVTADRDSGGALFERETDRLLQVNLSGKVWTKMGSMVAYRGDIKFTREGLFEHGLGRLLKRFVSSEGTPLTKAQGKGVLYLADSGKKVTVLKLAGETLFVNGNDVLAFQDGIEWDIKIMRKLTGVFAGGLFNVRLQGNGFIAITTHHDPLTLVVTPEAPVTTDPNTTVAWSGTLSPEFRTDVSLRTFLGRGSGESIQMLFRGQGFVVVQPYEEVALQRGR